MEKTKIVAVVGPTASGKSSLAVRLAKRIDGEIISCDSMQIYRGMDIGTAKVTAEEADGVPHHLIDVAEPSDPFSCSDYKDLAEKAVNEIVGRGKTPIFCGGTGLYLDSVLSVSDFSPSVPAGLRAELEKKDAAELWNELKSADPESADAIHPNNVKRVIRALEIYYGTGITKTEWDRRSKESEGRYDPLIIRLEATDREELYSRTDRRVDAMMKAGLVDECRSLALKPEYTAAQAIGYKEIYAYLDGSLTLDEAVELLKKNTRNYAKRQITWFKRYKDALPVGIGEADSPEIFENIVNIVKKHLSY
ncbi:MAG: tRNA (adenosine(37)-N6)-dimethylallyltransferase MiaA [Firmicutes bacterium]|nr:tRNA (adenosine(37)-N6)-dimethylallyltransferase MiaA [Candidatus Colimorpha enterica]